MLLLYLRKMSDLISLAAYGFFNAELSVKKFDTLAGSGR
jgi:hypothetical protein